MGCWAGTASSGSESVESDLEQNETERTLVFDGRASGTGRGGASRGTCAGKMAPLVGVRRPAAAGPGHCGSHAVCKRDWSTCQVGDEV